MFVCRLQDRKLILNVHIQSAWINARYKVWHFIKYLCLGPVGKFQMPLFIWDDQIIVQNFYLFNLCSFSSKYFWTPCKMFECQPRDKELIVVEFRSISGAFIWKIPRNIYQKCTCHWVLIHLEWVRKTFLVSTNKVELFWCSAQTTLQLSLVFNL